MEIIPDLIYNKEILGYTGAAIAIGNYAAASWGYSRFGTRGYFLRDISAASLSIANLAIHDVWAPVF